jgi:transposase
MLAKLLAAGMLPGTWVCDEQTRILRRQVTRRSQLVRGRTRARNQIHAVVIRNLGGRAPARDTFGKKGRAWLATLDLPADDRAMVDSILREADFLTHELAHIDREIARYAVRSAEIRRLMTIPGVDGTIVATLMATIGRIDRFPSPRQAPARLAHRIRSGAIWQGFPCVEALNSAVAGVSAAGWCARRSALPGRVAARCG